LVSLAETSGFSLYHQIEPTVLNRNNQNKAMVLLQKNQIEPMVCNPLTTGFTALGIAEPTVFPF